MRATNGIRTRTAVATAIVTTALMLLAPQAGAYLGFTVPIRGLQTPLKWQGAIRWFARDRAATGVPASALQTTIARAFASWEAVPTASIAFSYAGFTGASPFADDGLSVIGFESEPSLDRVLGSTGFTIDVTNGAIVEADIFINSAFAWSTADAGEAARFDLESVVLHEIGHFIGLGHSALGETELTGPDSRRVLASGSVMFPIAFGRGNTLDRTLQPDDIAGVSAIYPDGDFGRRTGTIRGRVTKNGRGVFGAHVVAFHAQSGALVGGFTLSTTGDFEIAGVAPGAHVLRVEPLDDASTESFFDVSDPVDANFSVAYANRLVVVSPGGVTSDVGIDVVAKP